MVVDPDITRQHIREELAAVEELAAINKWSLVPDYDHLVVLVTMCAHNGDRYVVEIKCDEYKQMPPLFEFIDPETEQRGTKNAYPKTIDSFFHDSGPCICVPFNRKAYKSFISTGPHGDWKFGDWQTSTANGNHWANYSRLGDMVGLIHTRISLPKYYRGRMK